MKIAYITTLSPEGSTNIGRVFPLAAKMSQKHDVTVLTHKASQDLPKTPFTIKEAGRDPFTRTEEGKKRLSGIFLIARMKLNVLAMSAALLRTRPNIIIAVKSLPENILATRIAKLFLPNTKVILDVDDFELQANVTSSFIQRAAIHWAERSATKLADHIVAATPFLADHFEQLNGKQEAISIIPTGLTLSTKPNLSPSSPRLVYIGSLSKSSGHTVQLLPDIFEEVRKEIPDCELHIVGDGDDRIEIKDKLEKKGLSGAAIWHGRFDVEKALDYLTQNTVIIDPIDDSIANRAKSSYRVALAVATGLPIVTSNIGVRDLLIPRELHNRSFATPNSVKDYAKQCITNLKNPLSLEEQEHLQHHAKQFTWDELADKYQAIIEGV